MSEKFSPTLRSGDLNDFIASSQACVVSLGTTSKKPDKVEVSNVSKQQTDTVKISLKDCLACSGCITSAETVMLERQSLGWICYAEKQLGSYILPYISSVKCPQQTMGATIKHHICKILQLRPDEVYHVTVMPCYDKKLEASRDDFVTELESHGGLRVAEVDSVLTSREILDLIQVVHDLAFNEFFETFYSFLVFNAIPLNLGGEENLLRFAMCYGFWDLQNIVRTIKLQKCKYHFVEVMACPSGCLNGGGQIKPKPRQTPKDLIQALETIYMENTRWHHLILAAKKIKTTSKRVAERKVAKFQRNISKRGSVAETSTKKGYDYPVGPILLGFFVFVVIGSSLFQIIRTATSGGMA
ncbi:hypothetical protein HS088_TW21G00676 [Tripterygium wilfordii]|uniref:Iron hydrogenase large subunit C-terminal domain-containing protein n=1 Tax=Tripterygium wilfordii TaxID=458696 RepID=A0A7J7C339_TRIWF|nr:hypothetical protein HS088_TW21G00676 [Tripterygium wilfordii]